MMATGEKVSQFMGEKNGEQREGKGDASGEACGMFVEKREGVDEIVIGSSLIIRVGDRELRAGYKAGAKSKQEQDTGEGERFRGRPAWNGNVLPFTGRSGAPIDVDWDGGRKVFWG